MVLRSMMRNATAIVLVLAVAASSQTAQTTGLQTTKTENARHLEANAAPELHIRGTHQMKQPRRKLQKSGCAIKPGANSNSNSNSDSDASIGNETIQGEITKAPKRTKAPKTPKPSKAPKTLKPSKGGAAATPAPVVTTAPVTTAPADDDDGGDDDTADTVVTAVPTTTPASAATTVPVADSGSGDDSADGEATPAPASAGNSSTPISTNDKLCAVPKLTVSDLNVGTTVIASEDEVALKVVAISAKPNGGSHIAFHSSGGKVQVMELDASDKVVTGSTVAVDVVDFADIYSDAKGFVVLGTRAAQGGGTLNCGNPSNLCGSAPSPAVPCYDMYLIRFEGGKEVWATKLTTSSASLPPYSSGKTGPDVYMIWWYAHHGRIAFDGTNWAAYFGVAISTSEGGCINIHQGDRMQVVGPSGALVQAKDAFALGCSHSGYERIVYDAHTKEFAMICKTDNNNRIKFPTSDATIYPVDLAASNLGDIVPSASGSGYWMTVSNGAGSNAKVHLMHFEKNKAQDKDIMLGGAHANERACHLASIGSGGLLAAWEGSSAGGDLAERSARTMYVQVRDAKDGAKVSEAIKVDASIVGNRYQALREFPDGSVAYLSKGASATSLKLLRIRPC